jgi:hypothetical protein
MKTKDNHRLRKAILEVIHTQIRDNDPPETKQTLRLIGYVVASEVFSVLKENRQYDRKKYISALNNLPRLPWEKEA